MVNHQIHKFLSRRHKPRKQKGDTQKDNVSLGTPYPKILVE